MLLKKNVKICDASDHNVDSAVVEDFGKEWTRFNQSQLSINERKRQFDRYFSLFPWAQLGRDSVGFDAGCGTGRWAVMVASRVGRLHCVEPSIALQVAMTNLSGLSNCSFHNSTISNMPFPDNSMDFGYSLGVLHHVPDTKKAIEDCVRKLKKGAPFLAYIYYAFDNQPAWYRWIWRLSDLARRWISIMPHRMKYVIAELIAIVVYLPFARSAKIAERMGASVFSWPLSGYRNLSFYTMRTDALDRFGTRLEKRFTKAEIAIMFVNAGLEKIEFDSKAPFYCVIGFKK